MHNMCSYIQHHWFFQRQHKTDQQSNVENMHTSEMEREWRSFHEQTPPALSAYDHYTY